MLQGGFSQPTNYTKIKAKIFPSQWLFLCLSHIFFYCHIAKIAFAKTWLLKGINLYKLLTNSLVYNPNHFYVCRYCLPKYYTSREKSERERQMLLVVAGISLENIICISTNKPLLSLYFLSFVMWHEMKMMTKMTTCQQYWWWWWYEVKWNLRRIYTKVQSTWWNAYERMVMMTMIIIMGNDDGDSDNDDGMKWKGERMAFANCE